MEKQLDRGFESMKPVKLNFDESKLNSAQLKALEIAREQGAKFGRKLKDLSLKLEPNLRSELVEAIVESRSLDMKNRSNTPF